MITGVKSLYYSAYLSESNAFDSISIDVFDERNNPIQEVETGGWPLVAGREYVLRITYEFNSSYTLDWQYQFKDKNTTLFPDVSFNGWYYDAVVFNSGQKLITGYKNGLFGVSDGIQRQDFLVILARMSGVDLDDYAGVSGTFGDVVPNSYYEAAVTWGAMNGIVTGYQNGNFGVGDLITREQIVTFLYRYAKYKGYNTNVSSGAASKVASVYYDYGNVSDFAREAVVWAIDKGAISGKTSNSIAPVANAQRCEIAKITYNLFTNNVLSY